MKIDINKVLDELGLYSYALFGLFLMVIGFVVILLRVGSEWGIAIGQALISVGSVFTALYALFLTLERTGVYEKKGERQELLSRLDTIIKLLKNRQKGGSE